MRNKPYVSVITRCRNDNYAGGIIDKLQFTIDNLLIRLEKHKIESEFIIIDWNPSEGNSRLKDAIRWPSKSIYTSIRVIEVESNIHRRYAYWENRDIHASVAVNVGIRRARGDFVVQRAADVIWSNDLISFIAAKKLEDDVLYRCNRKDVDGDILLEDSLNSENISDHCEENVLEVFGPGKYPSDLPQLHTNAAGDFQLMSRDIWVKMRGYYESFDLSTMDLENILAFSLFAAGYRELRLSESACVYKFRHEEQYNVVYKNSQFLSDTLMKQVYKRAYSYLVRYILARGLPVFQENIFMGIYRFLFGPIADKYRGIPVLPNTYYLNLFRNIVNGKADYVFNDENWGLKKEQLAEIKVVTAHWDA